MRFLWKLTIIYLTLTLDISDIDECKENRHDCSNEYPRETCSNTKGSFTCGCGNGFRKINNKCHDIDECRGINYCRSEQTCHNTLGSYECHTCEDGLEYLMDRRQCSGNVLADTILQQYVSKFWSQLFWLIVDSKVYWYRVTVLYPDIDECAIQADGTRSNNCHTHAACSNRVGSYSCSCNVGYQGNGQTCYGMFKLFILPNMSLIDAFVWLIYAYVFAA